MKLRAVARTSEAIEVHGWSTPDNPAGRIIHDLSGFRLRKATVPMMVNHGVSVIGEWTRLEVQDGNLVAHGVLKSTEPGDYASVLMGRLQNDLKYEASINFGDTMTVEEYAAGESLFVNGRAYDGPATVVRLFYIREISICGLGADPLTSTSIDADETAKADPAPCLFSATVRPRTALAGTPAEAEASPAPATPAEPETPPEENATEAKAVDVAEAVEGGEERKLSVAQLKQWSSEFGERLAVEWCLEGLDEGQARARFADHLKAELEKSRELVKQLSHRAHPQVDFIPSDDAREATNARAKAFLRAGMTPGEAAFAARHSNP
jgi:hypothetical protein